MHEFRFRIIAGPAGTGIRNINFGGQAQAADEPGLPALAQRKTTFSLSCQSRNPAGASGA